MNRRLIKSLWILVILSVGENSEKAQLISCSPLLSPLLCRRSSLSLCCWLQSAFPSSLSFLLELSFITYSLFHISLFFCVPLRLLSAFVVLFRSLSCCSRLSLRLLLRALFLWKLIWNWRVVRITIYDLVSTISRSRRGLQSHGLR